MKNDNYEAEVTTTCNVIKQQVDGVFVTLQQLDIKSTTNNVKYLFGIYAGLERIAQHISAMQQLSGGDEDVERERE